MELETLIQAIPIPLNATNGEVIKAIFPKVRISYNYNTVNVYLKKECEHLFDKEWWNSPYSESNPAFK